MWSIERMFDDMDRTVRRLDSPPPDHVLRRLAAPLRAPVERLRHWPATAGKYGGVLDVTCFEDPVPAEIGSGIVRSYGMPRWRKPGRCRPRRRTSGDCSSTSSRTA